MKVIIDELQLDGAALEDSAGRWRDGEQRRKIKENREGKKGKE